MPLFSTNNIVDVMRRNIVKCLVSNPGNELMTGDNTVFVVPNESTGEIEGKPNAKIYWLEFVDPDNPPENAIEIYWVPYKADSVPPVTMLGNNANFMFTAMMSGCSFGIGSDAGDGNVGVCHANAARSGDEKNSGLKGEAAFKQQKFIQQHMLYSENASQKIISYDKYMLDGGEFDVRMKSTTFGVHVLNESWKFYSLKYKQLPGNKFIHVGVDEM